MNGIDDEPGQGFAFEPKRAGARGIQIAVDPNEGLPRAQIAWSGKTGSRNAPVQVPGEKQRPTFRILMRKTPPLHGLLHRTLSRERNVAHAFVRAVPAFVPVCFQESARGGRAGRTRYRAGRGFCGLPEDLCAGKTCRARKPDTARLEPCATSRAAKAVTRPLGMGIVGNSGEKIGQDRDVRTCLLPVGAAWRNVIAERPPRAVVLKP